MSYDRDATSTPEEPTRSPPRLLVAPALLLLVGLGVAYRVAELQHGQALERHRRNVRSELQPIAATLSREVVGAIYLAEGISSLIAVEGGLSEERFRAFARELFDRNDLVKNVAIAPDNVVRFVAPLDGNERVLGFDYSRSPDQWPSVKRVIRDGDMVVAGPVDLVQGNVGVIGRSPIFVRDAEAAPSSQPTYWGLTSTVLHFDRLLERAEIEAIEPRLAVALRGLDGLGADGAPFWDEAGIFSEDPVVVDVPLPSGHWELAGVPRGGWPPLRALGSLPFLFGGLFAAALSGLLLRLLQAGHARDLESRRRKEALQALRRAHDELELRVAERTRELRVARDQAESADRLKSAFLATMSHELRTPLNSIIGFTGIVLQGMAGPLNEEQTTQLGMVRSSARHLLALINDVLDISKIEAGQLEVREEPFDLRESIERVVASVTPLAEARGLWVRSEVADGVGLARSDARRVEQVLLNLLNNAIKFTEVGGVSLLAERIEASEEHHDPAVLISVTDTGIGIEEEDLAGLFVPFTQIDSGLQRRHEGTGLGLAICHRLVELLGGTIEVRSVAGEGSTFSFTVPTGEV